MQRKTYKPEVCHNAPRAGKLNLEAAPFLALVVVLVFMGLCLDLLDLVGRFVSGGAK